MRWLSTILLLFASLAASRQLTSAQTEKTALIVLVSPPQHLQEATEATLAPWNLGVKVHKAIAPSESMPGARDAAQVLSKQFEARAVVWVTSNADGAALWVYDEADDRVVVRRLAQPPPFDEAVAASVALSIKTLLMHSRAAPPSKRFGAAPDKTVQALPPTWTFEAGGWGRHSAADDDSSELRVHLGVTRRLSMADLALQIQLGPGRSIQTSSFISGHFSDLAVAIQARYRFDFGNSKLSPVVGVTLHFTKLAGTLAESSSLVSEERINPTIDFGVRWTQRTGSLMWGLAAQTSYFVRRQRYLVRGRPVLELPELDIQVGAHVALPFR